MSEEPLVFNGIDGATGAYVLAPTTAHAISDAARGVTADAVHSNELKWRHYQATQAFYGVVAGVDPLKLESAGWGVIFAHDADPAIREALAPLLERRAEQAGDRCREYAGHKGVRPDESKNQWLSRQGAGPGPADPELVPYYLLIVGDPERIPFRFQYQLDVTYAVGRLHFETVEEYARYAEGVVAAETGPG